MNTTIDTPIFYSTDFLLSTEADECFKALWNELDWVRHDKVPRREYYIGAEPYAYGRGAGRRTYYPQPMHPWIEKVWRKAEFFADTKFDVCFLNGYEDQSDFLGWHADDSEEMDDNRPIAIVSIGAEREIWFRPIDSATEVHRVALQNGSLCIMKPGMQDTHQHRIPKAGRVVGQRVSFTFRGYVK